MRIPLNRVAAAGLVLALARPVQAQVAELLPPPGTGGSVEVTKALFDDSDFGALTSTLRGTFYTRVGDRASFVASLPLVYASADDASSTMLGNPEVGLAFRTAGGAPMGSVSVVLPLATEFGDEDFAAYVGFLSDYLHADRYASDLLSINAMLTPSTEAEDGRIFGVRIGSSVWIPTGDSGGDTELMGRYGAFLSHEGASVHVGLELAGMVIVSESDMTLGERTMHEAGISIGLPTERFTPELVARVPLDDDVREFLHANIGIRVRF